LTYDIKSDTINHNSDITLETGSYIRFVYLGSPQCAFCNNQKAHDLINSLKNFLKVRSNENGYKYISTGISVSSNSAHGFNFLNKSGFYDEIISGANWFNLGANYYVWNQFPGYPDTPQIILIKTNFKVRSAGLSISNIEQNDVLLKRVIGLNNIENYFEIIQNLPPENFFDLLKSN